MPIAAAHLWHNPSERAAEVVRDARKSMQKKMLSQIIIMESVINDRIETRNFNENFVVKPELTILF